MSIASHYCFPYSLSTSSPSLNHHFVLCCSLGVSDCGSNDGDGGVISGDRVVVTVGVILGSGDSGVILGSCWVHFGVNLT